MSWFLALFLAALAHAWPGHLDYDHGTWSVNHHVIACAAVEDGPAWPCTDAP